jgi:hypothetical protein
MFFKKSNDAQNDLTSLKLDPPSLRPAPPPETAAALPHPNQSNGPLAQDPRLQAEINRRSLELTKSGKHPEVILYLFNPVERVPVSLNGTNPPSRSAVLFSSAAAAHFFKREKKLAIEVGGIAFNEFPRLAEDLHARGFDSFVMDLSPRSPMTNVLRPEKKLITTEQVTFAWAVARTVRNFQAQRILRPLLFNNPQFATPENLMKLREALEVVRGAGGFDVPFVHWMIALIAGMQHDEAARLAATADLEPFGSEWVGKTAIIENCSDAKEWVTWWSHANFGLMTEFEMLQGPDGKPIPSPLRTVNIPPANPSPN